MAVEYTEVLSTSGESAYKITEPQLKLGSVSTTGLADAGIFETELNPTIGFVFVKDGTTTGTAVFLIKDIAGTVTTELIGTNAAFKAAKDNASTINVYIESDGGSPAKNVIKVQNNSGGALDISVSVQSS